MILSNPGGVSPEGTCSGGVCYKVQEGAMTMNLGDKVSVTLKITGEVVGRTFEGDPKVDLKLPWGMLNGIPLSVLKQHDEVEEKVATNVTEIRRAVRKGRKVAAAS